jgi:hypothetical protein
VATEGTVEARPLARRIFSRQIDEIGSDRALTLYGAALAAANVLTSIQWQFRSGVSLMIGAADRLCWPFWEACNDVRFSVWTVHYTLWAFCLVSALAAACFLLRRVHAGYWLLALTTVVRLAIMVQDYRLRANQHYMLNWVVLAFLFVPGKRALIRHVLVSLYFWAGVLKLDREWLSGIALYNQDRLWLPASLVPAACVYVVLLETLLIFGVYSRRNLVFAATLAQLVAFHIFSWPIVGFWYPTLMFCLLGILPLMRAILRPIEAAAIARPRQLKVRRTHAAVLATFAFLQLVPRAFPGDSALTGEGRVFSLHMFDALVVCEAKLTYRLADGSTRGDALAAAQRLPHRSRCDPLMECLSEIRTSADPRPGPFRGGNPRSRPRSRQTEKCPGGAEIPVGRRSGAPRSAPTSRRRDVVPGCGDRVF